MISAVNRDRYGLKSPSSKDFAQIRWEVKDFHIPNGGFSPGICLVYIAGKT
jgi:hypothetical protein